MGGGRGQDTLYPLWIRACKTSCPGDYGFTHFACKIINLYKFFITDEEDWWIGLERATYGSWTWLRGNSSLGFTNWATGKYEP